MINQKILNLMKDAAESSAQIIRDNFYSDTESDEKKSHKDIVTKTDKASQINIKEILLTVMKELGFSEEKIGFIEEESSEDSVREYTFIVDPIDGTSNFSAGIPHVCISIGYAKDKELVLGVVLNPISGDLYYAEKGKGAFLKNQILGEIELKPAVKSVKAWMVANHLNGMEVVDEQFSIYQKLYPHVRGMRNMGSLTLDLCFLAQGAMDLVMNLGAYFWDLAAASVILEEAGGQLYDPSGNKLKFDWVDTNKRYESVACHQENKIKVFELIK